MTQDMPTEAQSVSDKASRQLGPVAHCSINWWREIQTRRDEILQALWNQRKKQESIAYNIIHWEMARSNVNENVKDRL